METARDNLAASFVNGFVNAGFSTDKLLTPEGAEWIYKNKQHGKLSAAASLGLIYLWDVEQASEIDRYTYSNDPLIKAGALLASGIMCTGVKGEMDIALALLSEVERATAVGVDVSDDALRTARRNAEALGLGSRFTPLKSDWFANISGKFHVIASNPPYIPSNDLAGLQAEVRNFDPARALDGGADGLDAYRVMAAEADRFLAPAGVVGVEIGYTQKHAVRQLFEAAGYRTAEARQDIAGHDRVLVFHR